MVDFNLLGRVTTQFDMIVALFIARTHKKVVIICTTMNQREHIWTNFTQSVVGTKASMIFNRDLWRIQWGSDLTRTIEIVILDSLGDDIRAIANCTYDLMWFRQIPDGFPAIIIHSLIGSCNAGYSPLILMGDVPHKWRPR